MGVVRDVTVDNLVTAVGNIDTSSLAQDSTLQDVVTAIGNISGGSDPVTNTTVNSLCKDTTGQSIASAISGLAGAISPAASNVTFDNTGTGLSSSNVQAAISELNECKLFYKVVSGTTNSYGFIDVGLTADKYTLISAIKLSSNDNGEMAIPYRNTNASNSAQSLFIYNNNFVARSNVSVTFLAFFAKKVTEIS